MAVSSSTQLRTPGGDMETSSSTVLYAVVGVLAVAYLVRWRFDPLNSIPTVGGPSAPILSYLSTANFLFNGDKLLKLGYAKFHGGAFKIALFDQWMVIVSGTKMVDDLRKRPDDELSFIEGVEETMQLKRSIGPDHHEDPYHVDIIREKLMRSLVAVLPDVIDELRVAVPDNIPTTGDGWTTVKMLDTTLKIVARASSRVFVGVPVCRNKEYLDLAIQVTLDVMKDMTILNMVPIGFKGLVGRFLPNVRRCIRKAMPHLQPLLDERRSKMEEFGDSWSDKPNDMLQWVLEAAIPRKSNDESIVERIMLVNFAAIHTSSMSVTHAFYDLAAAPEYIQPLREEIEPIIASEGWTKAALGKMWKLDSFLRESQRYNGIGLTSMTRKALKDVTLYDGTFIPKGTLIAAATHPTHYDDALYADASTFDPFRFARLREGAGEGTKHQFVNTSVEYIPFGHGKHACPGRFFAANELKALLAYIVLNYDMKLANDGERPKNINFAASVVPNPKGEVMFRKRQVSAVQA